MSADQEDEFRRVVATVADPVRRYLHRRVDESTAEDVLSETLIVLWRRIDAVPRADVIPWAIGIARLQLSNALRSRRREERLVARIITVDPPADTTQAAGEDPAQALVLAGMAALRPADAEILRLWAWEELTIAEMSIVLELGASAVSVRLHRAKRRLATEIGKIRDRSGHAVVKEGRSR